MTDRGARNVISLSRIKVACQECSLAQLCLPLGIGRTDVDRLDAIIKRRRPLQRGDYLYRTGDRFHAVYVIRSGSLKTWAPGEGGAEQVTGFHLPGEMVGLEAIHADQHRCAAIALETTSVCEVPFSQLEELSGRVPALQQQLHRLMSREILRDHEHLLVLGKKTAEERLATFLVSLSNRLRERGYSATDFRLSMARGDIANYLGLAVETVSRLFTRFQDHGWLEVDRKQVQLKDSARLQDLAGVQPCQAKPRPRNEGQR
ncbi:MAG: transcriptional regulator FNR [Chromatiales bacterium 21-64-14]|nr:MAG: transcriptional regulator FNR [Chromatiales bacterium 21-64-14]HQU15743.1 fumarate/nitrate reduction transcriptional regulator Fnr [Gammaproteobacteria bacterium]